MKYEEWIKYEEARRAAKPKPPTRIELLEQRLTEVERQLGELLLFAPKETQQVGQD